MNPEKKYQAALELATTSRYKEAERILVSLLEMQPGNVDALILLGKVEYYLRHYSASRTSFETALLYEPGNTTAYFGIQFFRERIRNIRNVVLLVAAFFLLAATGTVLFLALNASFRKGVSGLSEDLSSAEANLRHAINRIERILEDDAVARMTMEERSADKLDEMTGRLERNTELLETFQRNTQTDVQGLRDAMTLQNEHRMPRNHLIEDLRRELQDLQYEINRSWDSSPSGSTTP